MKKKPTSKPKPRFRRVLLKLSGEALGGDTGAGISPEAVHDMARQVAEVRELGVEVVTTAPGGSAARECKITIGESRTIHGIKAICSAGLRVGTELL